MLGFFLCFLIVNYSWVNALKKSGVAQLKAAAVTLGTAKVQDAAQESDPKNQQVSFVISGKIKSTEVVENKPITIEQVEKMRADAVKFTEYKLADESTYVVP